MDLRDLRSFFPHDRDCSSVTRRHTYTQFHWYHSGTVHHSGIGETDGSYSSYLARGSIRSTSRRPRST